ncbi:MAG: hypothetical protein ACMZ7B_03970 [Balneola sp.]
MTDPQTEKFVFQKRRSLSELFSDSFLYFRQNSRSFITAFAVLILPILFLDSGLATINELNNPAPADQDFLSSLRPSSPLGLLSNIFGLITSSFMVIIVTGHIQMRRSGEHEITLSDYFGLISEYFGRIVGISIVVNLATWVGLIAFIVGAIYVGVKLALASITGILEDNRTGEAIEWSWNYTKDQWWNTLGVLFALWIPLLAFSFMILIPQYIILEILFGAGVISVESYNIADVFILQTPYFMTTFLQFFLVLGLSLFYFDLKEQKEGTSIIEKIDDLNSGDAPSFQ